MATQDEATRPLPKGKLLLWTGVAFVVGALIVVGVIMPAEFNSDPLGVGKLSGVSRLWAPGEKNVSGGNAQRTQEYATPWRTDVIEIPLNELKGGMKGAALEYKFRLQKDATLVYSWEVIGDIKPGDFFFDQHGHTTPETRQEEMVVTTYKQATGLKQNGSITAPFTGIHGWLFQNNGEKPVIVRLKAAGFYDLVPLGAEGNESRVRANVPAAQARPDTPFKAP